MKYEGKYILVAASAVLIIGAGALNFSDIGEEGQQICNEQFESIDNSDAESWKEFQLVDINTCETYSIAELEKPVLVETFAVWCSTCLSQQKEVEQFHQDSEVQSVSLDVDPNEDARKVEQHTSSHGFEWRYSISPARMTEDMVEEHGGSIRIPPRAPMIMVCENGSRKLPDGVKPVSKLQEEVERGC